MLKRSLSALSIAFIFATGAAAQEVEVDRYNVTARIDAAASALDSRASLALSNQSQSPKPKLYFRLTKLAKVTAATVNGAPAQVETAEDRRVTTLNQIIITPQTPLAAGATAAVEVSYRIEAPETSPSIHIYPGEALLAPEAVWVPMPSTMFALYGPNTAPVTVAVTMAQGAGNLQAASAGAIKGEAAGQTVTFDQSLNSLPLIVVGSFDQPVTSERGGVKVEVYAQKGLTAGASDSKAAPQPSSVIVTRLGEESGRVIDFLTRTLGPPPPGATFRIISSARANNIAIPGALVLNEQSLRRDTLTEATIESLADAIARIWVDGRVRVRGQEQRSAQENRPAQRGRSAAFLRDSLPRYLAALYFEDRFGKEAGRDAFARMRWSYTPVAQSGRDAELAVQTVALPTYGATVFGKGPLVFRLIAETMGRDKFMAAIKGLLTGAQTKVVTTDDLRAALVKSGGPEVEKIFQQWVDTIVEPDIIVGAPLPSDKPGAQRVNLRNLGTGDVAVSVLAVTASGKQLTATVTVPSENITSTDVATAEKIASIEVDPEKLIIQTNYDNDARDGDMKTAKVSAQTLFNQSIVAFNKGGYAEAENKLREALRSDPRNSVLHAWLARTLAAQKKMDEAVAEANAAIKVDPPVGSALAWAHITLAQAALARNQAAEAVQHLRRALVESEEAPAQFAAREAIVQASRAANMPSPVEESVRAFVAQFDAAIKQPSSDKLFPLVVRNNLKRFVQGLTVSRPTAWTTEILRADQIDANRVALDVGLKVRAEGRDQSGTAVFILSRAGQGWVLEDVQLFNVK
ncbi:MAG TPA: tetratricopeptide repeat protein [Blastocatellia bacterium]|nr:tetratricopeptide repeat protein [Blastocatellia bacterium]